MEDCPSFNQFLSYIMFVVPILVSQTRFNLEKKAVFGIMSSLAFLVYVPFGFLLVLTSTILCPYFCVFFLSDMELHLYLPLQPRVIKHIFASPIPITTLISASSLP